MPAPITPISIIAVQEKGHQDYAALSVASTAPDSHRTSVRPANRRKRPSEPEERDHLENIDMYCVETLRLRKDGAGPVAL